MTGRLAGYAAIITGAGQTPGRTMGNGRATALVFAREGATLILMDRVKRDVIGTYRTGGCPAPAKALPTPSSCRAESF